MTFRVRALDDFLADPTVVAARRGIAVTSGVAVLCLSACLGAALATWTVTDPSFTFATAAPAQNLMGAPGAAIADPLMQLLGLGAPLLVLPLLLFGLRLVAGRPVGFTPGKVGAGIAALLLFPGFLDVFPVSHGWPLPLGLGGVVGSLYGGLVTSLLGTTSGAVHGFVGGLVGLGAIVALGRAVAPPRRTAPVAPLGFKIRRAGSDGDEYGLDDTDTFEDDAPRFAALCGRLAHAVLSLKARLGRGEPRRLKVLRGEGPSFALAPEPARPRGTIIPPAPEEDWDDEDEPLPAPSRERAEARPPAGCEERTAREGRGVFRLPLRGPAAKLRERQRAAAAANDPADADAPARPGPAATPDGDGEPASGWDEAAAWDEAEDDPYAAEAARHAGPLPRAARAPEPTRVAPQVAAIKPGRRLVREAQPNFLVEAEYEFPPLALLTAPPADRADRELTEDALEANARVLEGVLDDFGVKGQIIAVRPGPVVTLYELEPAPGIKSSRVIGLADDIARSMSAISARVAVIPGKNAIGIELPNRRRVTVYLRELLASEDFERTKQKLPMCLGKNIGGEAVIADLARMPHLLVAGTTGSGKSVSINTMILSLLYHHKPETCRVILVDPKMLELSVYDGIPHLLTPVVTEPKKAVTALRWAVREMEDRYRKMAKLGVRNIEGYNARLKEAQKNGEPLSRIVQTGFDRHTGEAIFEEEILDLSPIPFIVIIVDEMADLMMVAGKDIEGAIQRLAQMARAAGIHLIMATQRPSVDVITGTIKANFPTRISFQVTSKIDSRTILGEMGAEQLLGMGDMLYMAGGGRIQRVHGPFVSDEEVEDVVAHLKAQGTPDYLTAVLAEEGEEDEEAGGGGGGGLESLAESDDLYDRAVALVLRDRKASTSYVQRRLSIGYNRAATLIERMEREGVVSPANHAGKRDILVPAEEEVA